MTKQLPNNNYYEDDNDKMVMQKTTNKVVSATIINELRNADVICGKDRLAKANQGNQLYRKMVLFYREEYQKAPKRDDKTKITNQIINTVTKAGGRFLRLQEDNNNNSSWVTVDAAGIHDKVSHSLRSARNPKYTEAKKKQDQSQQQQQQSGDSQLQLPFTKHEEDRFSSLVATQKEFFDCMMLLSHSNNSAASNNKQSEAFLFELLLQQQRQNETLNPPWFSSQHSSLGSSSTITENNVFGGHSQQRQSVANTHPSYSRLSSGSSSTITETDDDMKYSDDDTPIPVLFNHHCKGD